MNTMKNFLLTFFVASLILSVRSGYAATTYDDYTAFPPFLSSAIPPNILLVLDRSGSMGWEAYNYGTTSTYNPATSYEGYFVPTVAYEYDSAGGYWKESATVAGPCTFPVNTNIYTGSCLNYYLMDRIDLLRWSLTGGRPSACSGTNNDPDCDPDLTTDSTCSGTTCRLETNNGDEVEVPKTRIAGILQEFENNVHRPRFGVIFYQSGVMSDSVYIGDYYNGADAVVNDPYSYAKRFVNAMPVGGSTASGPALEEAYDYFKQNDTHSGNASPFNFAATPQNTHYRDPINICEADKSDCTSAPCMKNFVIFVSDGEWNSGADPVRPAYQMHTEVLRTLDNIDISVENVFTLGMFLGGSGELALKNVAMYGSYDLTSHTDNTATPPTTAAPQWPGNTSSGYPNSKTAAIPSSHPGWDKNSDGNPDTFFSAQDAGQIKEGLKKYIYDILKQSAAGSSVSILSERRVSGHSVHQALFFPSRYFEGTYKVDWTGVLNTYWFYNTNLTSNIREDNGLVSLTDTDPRHYYLDMLTDHPIDFTINSQGALSIDYYGTEPSGATDFTNGTLGSYSNVDEVSKIWEGGEKLRDRDGSHRMIYGVNESDQMTLFTAANVTDFDDLFGNTAGMDACLGNTDQPANLINYIRGEYDDFSAPVGDSTVGGCRTRVVNSTGDIWKLGDTVSSTPWVADYDFTNTTGTLIQHGVLYLGTNDGMLHAFHVGKIRKDGLGSNQVARLCDKQTGTCTQNEIGKELWSFVPKNSMPYLRYLANPDYQHMYAVDMAPYMIEDNGKKILIGGMRFGGATGCVSGGDWCGGTATDGKINVDSDGNARKQIIPPDDVPVDVTGTCTAATPENCVGLSSYFAIDVTDPYDPKFLWEFTHKDLGFSYSGPAFIRRDTGLGVVNKYIMFVSGPLNYKGFADGQEARTFILKVDDNFNMMEVDGNTTVNNNDVYIMDTGKTNAYGSRLFTYGIDADSDGNTDLVAFGVNWAAGGNWQGNVFAVGPTDDEPCTNTSCTTMNWELAKVFNGAHGPLTGKVVFNQCFGEPFIYYATGRWLYKDDTPGTGTNPNALYGVKLGECLTNLQDGNPATLCSDGLNLNSAHSSTSMCSHLSDPSGSWKVDGLVNAGGDFMEERSISDPTNSDFDLIFFTTTQPSSNICAFGGRTRLWGLNCKSGHAMDDGCPGGGSIATVPKTALLLQLSGGNIEDPRLDSSFTEEGGKATEFYVGIPPESGATIIPVSGVTGEVILWIER